MLFVLIPGAGGSAWYWHLVEPLLRAAGHETAAVELPADDDTAGLPEYAEPVLRACAGRDDVVLVAQSLGGFTAPLVCERTPVRQLVLVNAMIPLPGELAGEWGDHTSASQARAAADAEAGRNGEWDPWTYFGHDVPPDVWQQGAEYEKDQTITPMNQPCAFTAWPSIPIHVLAGRDDRLFPAGFQRQVARERLGAELDEISGGHLVALVNPSGVVQRLLAYLADQE